MDNESENFAYLLSCPFWIDTDVYSDRDRLMFSCGFEFNQIYAAVRALSNEIDFTIHRENESRIKMMCGKFKRKCKIEQCPKKHDPCGYWSYLKLYAVDEKELDIFKEES